MKKSMYLLLLALGSHIAHAQTARLQAIHNCPDPAAATVDVWLNNTKIIPGFTYKSAIPFTDLPSGVPFDITITAPGAMDTTSEVFRKSYAGLMDGETYVLVAAGALAGGTNPFDLHVFSAQEQATTTGAGQVSVKAFHGVYDAPMVDVYETQVGAGEIIPDLDFGQSAGYLDLPATDFDLQIRLQDGQVVGQFDANLTGLDDNAVIVVATGYADPSGAVGTEPFGLLAVLSNGTVVPLASQAVTPARLQVVHNCAATDAASVDVWLNDTKLLPNFNFRTASPFIDAPAGTYFDVTIAAPGSSDTVGGLFRQTFILESNNKYIVIAGGTVGSGSYSPASPFVLDVVANALESSETAGNVSVLVYHGATDAPVVNVNETSVPVPGLVTNLGYGDAAGYLDLPEADFFLDIEASGTVVASYSAPLASLNLENNAIIVLVSGFLNSAANNNAAAFGLWVALPSGGALIPLPSTTSVSENGVSGLQVYPVPANDMLMITAQENFSTLQILNAEGKLIESSNNINSSVIQWNVSEYVPGQYFVRLTTANSAEVKRFVVVR